MNLFIPEKIKVGYQHREETYTGKLAYVIYFDSQGKLRKETSWQRWRNEEIEPQIFENVPTEGFVLNKEVRRCNWNHFSSNRSYIRVYDPRGIEFEITPDNLIGLLMETDCNRRMFDGKFVYAWSGTELLLLPCGSESYKEALEHTKRQGQKVSARELKLGCSYTKKDGEEVIYIGRFPWYTWRYNIESLKNRKRQNRHIFWNGKDFFEITSMRTLASINSTEPVQEYPALAEKLDSDIRTREFAGWITAPAPVEKLPFQIGEKISKHSARTSSHYLLKRGDIVTEYCLDGIGKWDQEYRIDHLLLYPIRDLNLDTMKESRCSSAQTKPLFFWQSRGRLSSDKVSEEEALEKLKDCIELKLVFGGGIEFSLGNKHLGFSNIPGARWR